MSRDLLYRNIFKGNPDSPQMSVGAMIKDMSPMSSLAHTLLGASLTHTPRKRLSLSSSISDTPKSFIEFNLNNSSFSSTSHDVSHTMSSFERSPLAKSSGEKSPRDKPCRISPKNKENVATPYYSPSHCCHLDRHRIKSPFKEVQNTVNRNLSFSPLKKPISPARRQHLSPIKKAVPLEECDSNSRDSGYSESDQKRNSGSESDQKKDCFSIPRSCAPTRRLNLDMSPKNTLAKSSSREVRKLRSFASLTSSYDEDASLMDLIGGDDIVMEVDDEPTPKMASFSSLLSDPIKNLVTCSSSSQLSLCTSALNTSSCRSFVTSSPACTPTSATTTPNLPRLPIRRCLSMVDTTPIASASTPIISKVLIKTNEEKHITPINSFKRPQPPSDSPCPSDAKRRRSDVSMQSPISSKENFGRRATTYSLLRGTLTHRQLSSPEGRTGSEELVGVPRYHRSHSESHVSIMKALDVLSSQSGEVTGDFSRPLALPLISGTGKHPDLKSISADTMADLIKGVYKGKVGSFKIIDCRYPYEFEGGHIVNASNWSHPKMVKEHFDTCEAPPKIPTADSLRDIMVFHCEFSAERGPRAQKQLRSIDRAENKEHYPALHFPELYLLEGGYKSFFESYPELCVPNKYVRMLDEKHSDDLKFFRAKSKSWAADNKQNKCRTGLSRNGPKRLGL